MTFVKGVISRLKGRWPTSVEIYKTTGRTFNVETGADVPTREMVRIPKAIVLPTQLAFQLSQGAIGENLKFGGYLPLEITSLLIEVSDLKGLKLNNEDCQVFFNDRVHEVVQIQNYLNEAYIVKVKAIVGATISRIYDAKWYDYLHTSESLANG